MPFDRRRFLAAAAALASGALVPDWLQASEEKHLRLILLGTAGGPRPRRTRSAPSQVVIAGGAAYVIDCGDGVARQLVLAGVPLASLRGIFVTHQHSDHTADYGNLLQIAWTGGLRHRVDTWGPPPLARITRQFLAMTADERKVRVADEGRVALAPLVHAHDLRRLPADGLVMQDENVRVTAALVHHPPIVPAYAYRFDTGGRSIVISGDTTASENLVRLARGADVLVHEALFPAAVDRLVAGLDNAASLARSIRSHHTPVEEVGRIAAAAGVKTLVLSHLVPAEDPQVTEAMWLEGAAQHFPGRVVVGTDLQEIPLD